MAKGSSKTTPTQTDPYQGLLSGSKWAAGQLTYSFPDAASDYGKGYSEANKFQAFSLAEQTIFKTVIAQVESFTTDIEFTQLADQTTAPRKFE